MPESKLISDIRLIIREILNEDYRFMYDKNSFIPDEQTARTAQQALNVIQRNNLVNKSGSNEGSGINKAKTLATKEPMNHAQLKRMKAFFDNNFGDVQNEIASGKSINTSGIIQKWNLWGGDPGRAWAERQIGSTQSSNKTSKKVRRGDGIGLTKNLMSVTNHRIHR